jgi:hypothetical protein
MGNNLFTPFTSKEEKNRIQGQGQAKEIFWLSLTITQK